MSLFTQTLRPLIETISRDSELSSERKAALVMYLFNTKNSCDCIAWVPLHEESRLDIVSLGKLAAGEEVPNASIILSDFLDYLFAIYDIEELLALKAMIKKHINKLYAE